MGKHVVRAAEASSGEQEHFIKPTLEGSPRAINSYKKERSESIHEGSALTAQPPTTLTIEDHLPV